MSSNLISDIALIGDVCKGIIAKHRGYCPNKPHVKQKEFLDINSIEAGYGGAAGGGKSDALLMGALQYVHVPGYSALILRRTFRDLNQPDAIMARAHEWLRGTDARWNAQAKRYTFPSGATLTFGYFDSEEDKRQYASAAYQYIGFDEATQFPETWYTFLFSRLRRTKKLEGAGIPLRMRSATNPGGIGHVWYKSRFVDPETATAPFVFAKLEDNPHIDQDTYRESLSRLDRLTRDQLEKGVWRNDSTGLVYTFSRLRNSIQATPLCNKFVLGIDYGSMHDACAFSVLGWRTGDNKVYVVKSYSKRNMTPSAAAEEVNVLGKSYRFDRIIGDASGLGSGYVLEARKRFGLPVESAEKSNKAGYIKLLNGELEESKLLIVESECRQLIKEYEELPWSDEGRTKEAEGFECDCTDATLYGWKACAAYMRSTYDNQPLKSSFASR